MFNTKIFKKSGYVNLLHTFLLKNGINSINIQDFELQLYTQPNSKSFKAISDTLDYFGINNIVAHIPKESFNKLPRYFLTLTGENDELVLVNKKNDFTYITKSNGVTSKLSTSDFFEIWKGSIIAVEGSENKPLLPFLFNKIKIAPILFVFLYLWSIKLELIEILFLSLNIFGVYLSYLIIKEKAGYTSMFINKICRTSTSSNNCNKVINSKGSLLFNKVELADASFIVFVTIIFTTFFLKLTLGYILCLITLPVLIYSLIYQAFVIKKWCQMCLLIAATLFVEALLSFYILKNHNLNIAYPQIIEFLTSISIIIVLFYFIKKLIINNQKYKQDLLKNIRIKRDPFILQKLIETATPIDQTVLFEEEIVLGDSKADKIIIAYTNPYCGYCKPAFESYLKAIRVNDDIKIVIRFSVPKSMKNNNTKITIRLVELFHNEGEDKFIESYLDWLQSKDDKNWFSKYDLPEYNPRSISLLEKHIIWAKEISINYTPATIIGGKFYPDFFDYDDLPFVLNSFFEFESIKNKKNIQ